MHTGIDASANFQLLVSNEDWINADAITQSLVSDTSRVDADTLAPTYSGSMQIASSSFSF
jgi:hypothetical protein